MKSLSEKFPGEIGSSNIQGESRTTVCSPRDL